MKFSGSLSVSLLPDAPGADLSIGVSIPGLPGAQRAGMLPSGMSASQWGET